MTFNGVVIPPDALPNAAYDAGQEYIQRFLPSYYTVRRDMYKKGKGASKEEFLAAFRRAEVANWQGAIDAWTEILKHTTRKNAGRACLDIAVSYEVLGKTDLALQWAQKAYQEYGDDLARTYAKTLLARKNIE
jgi:tetratricopeptide (TPR) repeat protein